MRLTPKRGTEEKNDMPVKSCTIGGKPGYKWGDAGKCYPYEAGNAESEAAARASATRQGQAAYASGYQGTSKVHDQKSFKPPQNVRAAAAKGLKLRKEFGRGGLDPQEASEQGIGSGVVRAAQLKNGGPITYDTIKRMVNYFSRHGNDKNAKGSDSSGYWGRDSNPSAGYVAWLLWGGNPGKAWAEGIKRRVEAHEESEAKKQRRNFKPGSPADDRHAGKPAKPSERITGSPRNKPGTATAGGGKISLSKPVMTGLESKATEHNDKHGDKKGKKVTVRMLAAVYRRGAGAFSVSHRPGMTRGQWAMARVNHFLRLVRTGRPADPKYITDNDLLPKGHPRSSRGVKKMDLINQEVLLNKHIIRVEDTEEGIMVLFGRSEDYEGLHEDPVGVGKSEDYDIDITFPITKVDDKRLITGIVLEPDEVDAHKDFETAGTIEEAAHNFLRKYNQQTQMGVQHQVFGSIGVDLVESYLAPADIRLGGQDVKKGSWVITVKVHDDGLWDRIKKGEITGFSIGGRAKSRPAEVDPS